MTTLQVEEVLLKTDIKIAVRQRFAFDTGTMLRLDNYAIINIFDDGRYFIQGENTEALIAACCVIEPMWDPDTWSGQVPRQGLGAMMPLPDPVNRLKL